MATSMTNPVGWSGIKLSSTRNLITSSNGGNFDLEATLIDTSGANPAELDFANVSSANHNYSGQIAKVSDTLAVVPTSIVSSGNFNVYAISTASDTLTFGSAVTLGSAEAGGNIQTVINLDGSTLLAFGNVNVFEISVSGTTITDESNSLNIDSGGATTREKWGYRLSDTQVILFYELSTGLWANVFTLSGGVLSRGTPVQLDTDGISELTGFATEIQAYSSTVKGVYFLGVSPNSTNGVQGIVVTYDATNGIVVQANDVQIGSASIAADHVNVIRMGSDYVGMAYQDETTTPIQQIGARIITP